MITKLATHLLALVLCCWAPMALAIEANAADAVALDAVKGIGPATSAAIIQARKAGPFKSWADLVTRVRGVGEANAARLSAAGLTVNGQPYIRVQPVAATATATATAAALPASATGAGRPR
jgi:competence protein ComEA